ncbi:UPF0149 family protein [Fastidiosibacter lacustris]|uniref:UPF0149 family protein n=1 Tax=Fastidiosibacter lacustris TaxID=2056695 RepID=UPI000E340FB5|nr:UPF0149 family protein [Fastidiosibacter lacustris]
MSPKADKKRPLKLDLKKINEFDELLLNLYPEPEQNFTGDEHIFSLSMLDGYLTAVLLCPEFIDEQDWLEGVWQEGSLPHFKDPAEQTKLLEGIAQHYDTLKHCFDNELVDFEPFVYHKMYKGQAMPAIDLWLDGFERGFEYFEAAWHLNPQIESVIDEILGFDDECDFENLSLDQRNKELSKLSDLIIQLYALKKSSS